MPNNIPDCSSLQNNLPHYASTSVLQQHPIISMEDDDMSDQEVVSNSVYILNWVLFGWERNVANYK